MKTQIYRRPQPLNTLPNHPIHPINVSGETHIGLVRKCNEDSFGYIIGSPEAASIIMVADGIGGHDSGDLASQTCVAMMLSAWRSIRQSEQILNDSSRRFLVTQIQKINEVIYGLNRSYKIQNPMGTTLVVGVILPDSIVLAHAGDSRCYRLRNGTLKSLTQDHSYVAELLRNRVISDLEADDHPFAHVISRSIGPTQSVDPEVNIFDRKPGDRYLFCSDGVCGYIDDIEIESIMIDADTPQEASNSILHAALRSGGQDNITLVIMYS